MTLQITGLDHLRLAIAKWRRDGERVALVPTMGALHSGHLRLVTEAMHQADRVIVSIFVNPTQFGPNEDFNRYPRPLERDVALLKEIGADAVWLPTVEEMYPAGFATSIHIGNVTEGLCGASRPVHFDGVATVVAKLLLQTLPDVALFGEKDYQQLCLIKRLAIDLNIPVRILGVPTARESDGLALSSRNQYLSEEERTVAPAIYRVLTDVAAQVRGRVSVATLLEGARVQLLEAGFSSIEYLELRAEETLAPLSAYKPPARLLIAARLGKTRLIDNLRVE